MKNEKNLSKYEMRKFYLDSFKPFQDELQRILLTSKDYYVFEDKWQVIVIDDYSGNLNDYVVSDLFRSVKEWGTSDEVFLFQLNGNEIDNHILVAIDMLADFKSIKEDLQRIYKRRRIIKNNITHESVISISVIAQILSDYYSLPDEELDSLIKKHMKVDTKYSKSKLRLRIENKIKFAEDLIDPFGDVLDRKNRLVLENYHMRKKIKSI